MKTIRRDGWRLLVCQLLAFGVLTSGLLFYAEVARGLPRGPIPPVPEMGVIYYQGFDRFHSIATGDTQAAIPGLGLLVQSWSGYALDRSGQAVLPFMVPALDPNTGHTNLVCDSSGAVRIYYTPYYSSATVAGGAGPGSVVHLADLVATSQNGAVLVWSLQVSADGTVLQLLGNSDSGPVELVSTIVQWQANTAHMIAVNYGAQGTALIVDGQIVSQGAPSETIPLSVGALVFGSSISGTAPAQGTMDELFSFDHPLTAADAGFYYRFTAAQAALGPVSGSVLTGGASRMMALRQVYDPDHDITCSPGGPVRLTNIVATLQTNGLTTASFDIQGGTNGVLYDIYSTSSLSNTLDSTAFVWLGQGLTCNTYTFTNQPPNQSFYILEVPQQTTVWAWGNNKSGQCNVPLGLYAATAVAAGGNFSLALLTNGTVVGWGTNNLNQLSIPAGITNATAIAAGQYHGLALLTNGAVTNWGSYWDGAYFYPVTNYTGFPGPPTTNVMAIAAGLGHDIALLSNGTVVAWGLTNLYAMSSNALAFQSNLTGVKAIAAGWNHNVALLSNGLVKCWIVGATNLSWNLTNVPASVTNVVAIACGPTHSLALLTNGTVAAWGVNDEGETNVPSGLTNIVAISAGGGLSMALHADGTLVVWGDTNLLGYPLPTNMLGVKGISSGFQHNLAVASDGLPPLLTYPPAGFAPTGGSLTFSVTGLRVANLQYQWQFNGTNIVGATNSTFLLTDAQAINQGSYQCVVSNTSGVATSMAASFNLAYPPEIESTTPLTGVLLIATNTGLSVVMNLSGVSAYPLIYQWQLNGTNIAGATNANYTIANPALTNQGSYAVIITNSLGTNSATWVMQYAGPGLTAAWGDNDSGESAVPAALTNAAAIAAALYQSVAVTDAGTVKQWGEYSDGTNFYSVTNFTNASPPPGSGVVAVAAGMGQALALLTNGTVVAWGLTNAHGYVAYGTQVPAGISNVIAVSCGWQFNVVLLSNGTVRAWGLDDTNIGYTMTNVPVGLSNVTAIAAGGLHTLALTSSNTVVAWGYNGFGECTVPAGLTNGQTNVVAIAAGDFHSLALTSNGTVVGWGDNSMGQCTVPAGLSNVMAIAAGSTHSVALENNGTIVEWGDNDSGQAATVTSIPEPSALTVPIPPSYAYQPPVVVKLIAAGGDHTLATAFSISVQYTVDVANDLLLIYNTNSLDSSNVCQYYRTHRPMVYNANVLGIGVTTDDPMLPPDYTNTFLRQVQTWLSNTPTKRPQYVILFQNVPEELDYVTNAEDTANPPDATPSVQYQLHNWAATGWRPYVTAIDMNGLSGTNFYSSDGTNDCIAYINKLTNFGTNGQLIISASAGNYANTNWYFDFAGSTNTYYLYADGAKYGVTNVNAAASVFGSSYPMTISHATNVLGYFTGGWDGGTGGYGTNDPNVFVDGTVRFSSNSGWFIMTTIDSFDGQRVTFQAGYLTWFTTNSFGGTNYSNTPVGAVTTVDEPQLSGKVNPTVYYGEWAAGKSFAISAWVAQEVGNGEPGLYFKAVGDPFVRR